jgi:hypothetical protein
MNKLVEQYILMDSAPLLTPKTGCLSRYVGFD